MVAEPPSGPFPPGPETSIGTSAGKSAEKLAAVHAPPLSYAAAAERSEAAPALDGRQIFFLFVGSALAACLIFALGVTVGRRIEQHAAAQKKTEPADPLAVLDEIANAEEALTFHRAVLDRHAASLGVPAPEGGAPKSRYALHSATFAQRPAAEELVRRLRDAGYKAKLLEVPAQPGQSQGQSPGSTGKPAFRLQIGDYAALEGAQPVRAELLSRFGLATSVAKIAAPE